MNCKKTKELIMDFIDGELSPALQGEIKRHLASCDECRQFEQTLRHDVIEPVRVADKIKAPERIWDRIKADIETRHAESQPARFFKVLRSAFETRKPAFVLATAAAVILIAVVLTRLPINGEYALNTYIEEQTEFFSYLTADNGTSYSEMEDMGFGTSIEEYLL